MGFNSGFKGLITCHLPRITVMTLHQEHESLQCFFFLNLLSVTEVLCWVKLLSQIYNLFRCNRSKRCGYCKNCTFIHSFLGLPYDRSIVFPKASSPQSVIQCFLFQCTVSSLLLKIIQQLLTCSFSSSCHFYPPFYLSFSNVFQKAVPTQDVFNPLSLPSFYYLQVIPLFLVSM